MYKKFIFIIVYFIFISCSNEKQNFLENISFGDDTTLDIITWNIENKSCQLLSSCTKYNTSAD